ncbi:GNAT family N-acetyltransferase [Alkalihalobacillus sp. TS-13]|uniref:GNAT family N-acetyltransferase n=1 Tax=Alkalihalobacillus sp. TS-13 TaxID=2842455 RepID=UPI001C87EBA6|nr:GNAT family N-acetyltransferase [Alkalihalobacillus sp. TS-13]
MIRKLTEKDHEQVMSFLSEERAINLFIIGDIENFGYETDFQQIWGEWDRADELIAILLRYKENFIPYAKGPFDVEGFAKIITSDENFHILSGKEDILEQFGGYISSNKKRSMYFAELINGDMLPRAFEREGIRMAEEEDVEAIFMLRERIEEFTDSISSRESLLHSIRSNTGRTYLVKDGDFAITSVSTTAENSMSAMVVGVCTDTAHRNKGLASRCLSALCEDVLKEGKTLCLFYDNPAAGSIYKRLGFKDIGRWTMWHNTENQA